MGISNLTSIFTKSVLKTLQVKKNMFVADRNRDNFDKFFTEICINLVS